MNTTVKNLGIAVIVIAAIILAMGAGKTAAEAMDAYLSSK